MANIIEKRENEVKNYVGLLDSFAEHEKLTLNGYTEEDETKLIFFNHKTVKLKITIITIITIITK